MKTFFPILGLLMLFVLAGCAGSKRVETAQAVRFTAEKIVPAGYPSVPGRADAPAKQRKAAPVVAGDFGGGW